MRWSMCHTLCGPVKHLCVSTGQKKAYLHHFLVLPMVNTVATRAVFAWKWLRGICLATLHISNAIVITLTLIYSIHDSPQILHDWVWLYQWLSLSDVDFPGVLRNFRVSVLRKFSGILCFQVYLTNLSGPVYSFSFLFFSVFSQRSSSCITTH